MEQAYAEIDNENQSLRAANQTLETDLRRVEGEH